MGAWIEAALDQRPQGPLSKSAARKIGKSPGHFVYYRPNLLCSPGFQELSDWIITAEAAEAELASIDAKTRTSAAMLSWVLNRSESLGSSTIEGVEPSLRRVARAEASDRAGQHILDTSAAEAIGNIKATEFACQLGNKGDPLTLEDILELHKNLMDYTSKPEIGGNLRSSWVWIGGVLGGYPPPSYVPPAAHLVPDLLKDLIEYMNSSTHHPLIAAAVAHTQFEIIHPFSDGNGRTGRALIQTVLRSRGWSHLPVLPISSVLARRRDDYINALESARYEGDGGGIKQAEIFDAMLSLFASSVRECRSYTEHLTQNLDKIISAWETRVSGRRKHAAVRKLLKIVPQLPVFTVDEVADRAAVPQKTAYRAVQQLLETGIVVQSRGKYKGQGLFEVPALLDLLKYMTDNPVVSELDIDHTLLSPAPPPRDRRGSNTDEAIRLRRAGLTHREIGKRLGLSTSWAQKTTKGIKRG